jgi:hypothetical protein
MYISRDLEAEKNIFSRSSIHLGQPAVDLGTTSMDQDLAGHPGTQRKWVTHIKHGHIMVISIGKIWKNHQMGYEWNDERHQKWCFLWIVYGIL